MTTTEAGPPWWLALLAPVIRRMPIARYRAVHAVGTRITRPFVARLPASDALCRVDLRDGIARDAYLAGSYEPVETALVRDLLHPGATMVDVGANWGYYSLLAAARVGAAGRVVSCEPHPALFQALSDNLARNRFDWAIPVQVAVAASTGRVTLEAFDPSGGNSGISRVVAEKSARTIDVAARALDDILQDHRISSVDLLKVDVEGAEGFVLAGARRALAERRVHRLLLELHPFELPRHGQSATQLMRDLVTYGYRGWTIGSSRRAGYRRHLALRETLTPVIPEQPLAEWPHQLWLAPGVELPA